MPWTLAAYALLLVVVGVLAVVDVVDAARKGNVSINLAVVCLIIGIGILRRREWWRKVAVLFAGVVGFVTFGLFVLAFIAKVPPEVVWFGRRIQDAGPGWCLVGGGLVLAMTVVEFWILMRRPARDAMVRRKVAH